ncbi:MAG: hypothetical protein IT285_12085, partial [Bdellovibrionales bacterium]|nr:hypothetical protein [Bdellovibrionales bacterium]
GYTHDNVTNSENITLTNAGDYLIHFQMPLYTIAGDNNIRAEVRINGAVIDGGVAAQGYIEDSSGAQHATLLFSGIAAGVGAGSVLTVTATREGNAGTVTVPAGTFGQIFVERLATTANIAALRGNQLVSGTNWNPAAASSVQWSTQDLFDAAAYTHSTSSNSHQVTVDARGDYLLLFNDHLTAAITRPNSIVRVQVNGVTETAAEVKSHMIRNTGGVTESSGSLVFLIRDLRPGDIVSVTSVQEAAAGTINDASDGLLFLWKK